MHIETLRKWWWRFTLLMGVFYIFVMPPFQTPDEPNHFQRIYQITQGRYLGEVSEDKTNIGGQMPKGILDCYAPFEYLKHYTDRTIRLDTIKAHLFEPIRSRDLIFSPFPNTARYAFTAYLPQSITIFILDSLNVPPLLWMYACRFSTFLIWLTLLNWAIRITPVYKELFMFLSLLPTSLTANASLSADVMSNGLAFVIFALFFKFKTEKTNLTYQKVLLFTFLMLLISWQKVVYFPLLFLLVLVPSTLFGSLKKKFSIITGVFIVNVIVILLWANEVNKLTYPDGDKYHSAYSNVRPGFEVNPALQIDHILKDPLHFAHIFLKASFDVYPDSFSSYVSAYGWEGHGLPSGLYYILTAILLAFLLLQIKVFTHIERLFLLLLCHGLMMLFLFVQHLQWDALADDSIITYYSGKYYIPIYPVLFFALTGLLNFVKISTKFVHYSKVIIPLIFIIIHIDFLIIIIQRYYA
jgi:uncharacterized membrane protein